MSRPSLKYRFATPHQEGWVWSFKRNCALSPAQLGWAFLGLCALSLMVAGFFWFSGAWLVLPFACIELIAVGAGFLMYARHAADRESLTLGPRSLVVEWERAGKVQRVSFSREWVRVESGAEERGVIEVSGGGCSVSFGHHVPPSWRRALAQEVRWALHHQDFPG